MQKWILVRDLETQGGEYEECGLLGCGAVQFGRWVPKCTASHPRKLLMLMGINIETEKQDQNEYDMRRPLVVSYRRFGTDRLSGNVGNETWTYAA